MSMDSLLTLLSDAERAEPVQIEDAADALAHGGAQRRGWPGAVLGQRRWVESIDAGSGATDYRLRCEGPRHVFAGFAYLHATDALTAGCRECDEALLAEVRDRVLIRPAVAERLPVIGTAGTLGERCLAKVEA